MVLACFFGIHVGSAVAAATFLAIAYVIVGTYLRGDDERGD